MRLNIYLADLVHDYLPGNYVVPLNVGLIAAYLEHKFSGAVVCRIFKSPSKLLESLGADPTPQIIAFSNYSWNQVLNRKIIEMVRGRFPDTAIVMGGPHIRVEAQGIAEFLTVNTTVDYYCMFEGEITIASLVEHFLAEERVFHAQDCDAALGGVAYINKAGFQYEPLAFKKGVIEDIPSPYLSGFLDEFLSSPNWVPILETNRGCPYRCTFCVWGIAAMDKVRIFPMDRIFEEMHYVAEHSLSPRWIYADANFGMLPRDLEIAKELRRVANNNSKLRKVQVWWAKNSSKRTVEIAHILDSLCDPLAAVQTMDQEVLTNIKRDNIKYSTMTDLLERFHKNGLKASTDVLAGLPGESYKSHLNTLRETFRLGFDFIDIGNIRLLPGSEMESDVSRKKYDLKTKYRLISGSYGQYDGLTAFEYEESVRSTKVMSEREMHHLRLIHFLVFCLWNFGIAKPLLRFIFLNFGKNPMDIMLQICKPGANKRFDSFIADYQADSRQEWFESPEELESFFTKNFDQLIANGFLKLNFKYMAEMFLDRDLIAQIVRTVSFQLDDVKVGDELAQFCLDRIYFPGGNSRCKTVEYSYEFQGVMNQLYPKLDIQSGECVFTIEQKTIDAIDFELNKFHFETDPRRALALTFETFLTHFLYDFRFVGSGKKEKVGDLTGSFDYHAPLGLPQK
jgi:radical SAM superfamily enzyme YgiQ (UPF0313 family)